MELLCVSIHTFAVFRGGCFHPRCNRAEPLFLEWICVSIHAYPVFRGGCFYPRCNDKLIVLNNAFSPKSGIKN